MVSRALSALQTVVPRWRRSHCAGGGHTWVPKSPFIHCFALASICLISVFSYPDRHQIPQQALVYRPVFEPRSVLDSPASRDLINVGRELAMLQAPYEGLQR